MTIDEYVALEERVEALDWTVEAVETTVDASLSHHVTIGDGYVGTVTGQVERTSRITVVRGDNDREALGAAWLQLREDLMKDEVLGEHLLVVKVREVGVVPQESWWLGTVQVFVAHRRGR